MKELRLLMTGAGAPGAAGIIRCYKNNGERQICVFGADIRDNINTKSEIDSFIKNLPASSPYFIEHILTIAVKNKINVIQPLVTKELELFSSNIEAFYQAGIAVCVSPIENLQIANDKGKLLEVLQSSAIDVPRFVKISNVADFETALRQMGYPCVPVCFKPTKANGSRGFRIIDNSVRKSEILFNQKPNTVYMSYQDAVATLSEAENIPELLVMEYLPGKEYSVDMLLDNGKTIYSIPRLREAMSGGISTDCTVIEEQDVIEYCTDVAETLKLHGNIGIQVRRDVDGKVKILEINPRVQGSIVCCAAAGVNLPYYGIKLALKEPIPNVPVKWGTRMVRHWKETYYDNSGQSFAY